MAGAAEGVPDSDPGSLIGSTLAVPPGGNRVRSYLDIVAPDGAVAGLPDAFRSFIEAHQDSGLPWVGRIGSYLFRVEMDEELAASWPEHVGQLLEALRAHLARGEAA